jgi:hypothetical protein
MPQFKRVLSTVWRTTQDSWYLCASLACGSVVMVTVSYFTVPTIYIRLGRLWNENPNIVSYEKIEGTIVFSDRSTLPEFLRMAALLVVICLASICVLLAVALLNCPLLYSRMKAALQWHARGELLCPGTTRLTLDFFQSLAHWVKRGQGGSKT